MKEIKGLEERLSSLQERLVLSEQIVQDQADMAQVVHIYLAHVEIITQALDSISAMLEY